jgi:hypothetical protein
VSPRDAQLILLLIATSSAAEFDTFEPLAEQVLNSLAFPPRRLSRLPATPGNGP